MLQFSFGQHINAFIVVIGILCVGDIECNFFRIGSNGDCVSPKGDHGICRNISDCKALLGLLIKSKSRPKPSVIDFLRRSHCGFEGKNPIVCCPIEDKARENRKRVNLVVNGGGGGDLSGKNLLDSCGGIQVFDKIIGGNKATLYEFPWMALIGYKTRHGLQYRCGGTLISPRYVLTAAHCVSTLTDILPTTVRLGEYNLETREDCETGKGCAPPPKDYAIEEVIPHKNYFKPELRNDIALIRLSEKAEIKDSVRPICLPLNGNISERLLPEEQGVVTGWGTTETGIKSSILLKATLPIVSRNECSNSYKTDVPITESQICAGGEAGKDSCSGDSGGPLQVTGVNPLGQPAYIQHGIVSFGSRNCGLEGKPGVYTKVAHYIDWILKNMKE